MEPQVSSKSTKNQILEAYEELLKQQQDKKSEEPKKVQEEKQKTELTEKAAAMSNESIVKNIADIKVSVAKALDELSGKFVSEYQKFEELQKAISIEKKNLDNLYALSANTDSFAAMLQAQKTEKEKFEQEMAARKTELEEKMNAEKETFEQTMTEKRATWKKEQEMQDASKKESDETLKKARTREEEEYKYNLTLKRKKDEDAHNEKQQQLEKELTNKKTTFEQEIASRMAKLEASETELEELRNKDKAFPAELGKAVEKAVKEATDKLNAQHGFESQLKAKEVDGELKLKDQTIATLNAKIKEMEASMKDMSAKTATAEASVKDIALKAIESGSKPYYIEKNTDNKQDK